MQGLSGSHPEGIAGDLQGAVLAQVMFVRWWAALRWCEAADASPDCSPVLSGSSAITCFWGHLPWVPPPPVGRALLAWRYSMGLLSKHLKLAFVHLFNGSPPHVTLVRKRLHWLAQPSSWKPSSVWLDGFQPSISPNRVPGRVCGYFCLSASTGGLEKNRFPSWTFILTLKKKKSVLTWLS